MVRPHAIMGASRHDNPRGTRGSRGDLRPVRCFEPTGIAILRAVRHGFVRRRGNASSTAATPCGTRSTAATTAAACSTRGIRSTRGTAPAACSIRGIRATPTSAAATTCSTTRTWLSEDFAPSGDRRCHCCRAACGGRRYHLVARVQLRPVHDERRIRCRRAIE